MTQRKLDKLLKELYSEENEQMLQDMEITPLDDMLKRVEKAYVEEQLKEKTEKIKGWERRRAFRQQTLRSAAIACTILIVSAIFAGFFDNNPVKAWQMNLKTTVVAVREGIMSVFTQDTDENPPIGDKVPSPQPGNIIVSGEVKSITPEQAINELPFKLPMPEYIPEGFEFKNGQWESLGTMNNFTFIYMTNDDPPSALVYDVRTGYEDTKQTISAPNPNSTVKEIQVGSRNVLFITIEGITANAHWSDNQFMFSVGGNVDEDTIIKIIESLK